MVRRQNYTLVKIDLKKQIAATKAHQINALVKLLNKKVATTTINVRKKNSNFSH
jgi:hypothetical protein